MRNLHKELDDNTQDLNFSLIKQDIHKTKKQTARTTSIALKRSSRVIGPNDPNPFRQPP